MRLIPVPSRMTVTDPVTFTQPVVLTKSWTWRPGLEVLPFQGTEK